LTEENKKKREKEYRHDYLFEGEGSIVFRNKIHFYGTVKGGKPQLNLPFKFIYRRGVQYKKEKEDEEPTCTLYSGPAELKHGKYQTGKMRHYECVTKSGDMYDGNKLDQQG